MATSTDAGPSSPAQAFDDSRGARTRAGEAIAVRLRSLTKRFGPKTAVDSVTLTIESGCLYGLIGPNGAGKTTTFSMMAGYLRPTQGSLTVLGFAPTSSDDLRSRLGVLPQDALLPPGEQVGELLVHFARLQGIARDRAPDAAKRALDGVQGGSWWRQRCGSLSHGMAKRVALAQALLGDPELVLLDEPSAGLDPRTAWEIRQLIKSHRGRRTMVISSHNLQELEEICDAAAILDRGRIVASGTMAELTAANDEFRVKVGTGTRRGTTPGAVPIQQLQELPSVKTVDFLEDELELMVCYDRTAADAETVIGQVLTILLQNQVRISGVVKGHSLERRVMNLT